MKAGTQGHASTRVDASADEMYALVSDIGRMGEWSPECRRCMWIEGATGPAVGAHFKGTNRRGVARWSTTATVTAADPGREFGFVTGHVGQEMTRWTYRFDAISGGSDITETFEMLRDVPWYFRFADRVLMGVRDRHADLEANLAVTLDRLKRVAEGGRVVR